MGTALNTKILFISPPAPFLKEPGFVPNIGILYLSAVLKNINNVKPQTKYLEMAHLSYDDARKELHNTINKWKPMFVAFTATTPQFPFVKELAKEIKKQFNDIRILIGGTHATNYNKLLEEDTDSGFDYIFVGEAENTILQFWKLYTSAKTPPGKRIYEEEGTVDINKLPIPDWQMDGLDITRYSCSLDGSRVLPIISSRGCYYKCAFCEKYPSHNRRERSIDLIENEISLLIKMNIYSFTFYDCCLVVTQSRALKLKNAFQKLQSNLTNDPLTKDKVITWRAFMRTDCASFELLTILKDAGCKELGFGIESGSDLILNKIKKGTTRTENTQAIITCRVVGLRSKAFLMVGLPYESKSTIRETISWLYEAFPDSIDVSLYMPYMGSAVERNPKEYKVIIHKSEMDFADMYYKGRRDTRIKSFISTRPRFRFWRGLSRKGVMREYEGLMAIRNNYNELASTARIIRQDPRAKEEILQTYNTLGRLVMHEGELIWKQTGLFISLNSLLLIILGLFVRVKNPEILIIAISSLGIISSIIWYLIYKKSWYNQRNYFALIRKQELNFLYSRPLNEGYLLSRSTDLIKSPGKKKKPRLLQRIPILRYVVTLTLMFTALWGFILFCSIFHPKIFELFRNVTKLFFP